MKHKDGDKMRRDAEAALQYLSTAQIDRPVDAPEWSPKAKRRFLRAWRKRRRS